MAYVPIGQCTVDTSVISQLPNEPVSPEYTAAQFKAAFDSAGTGIKSYINTTLANYVNNLAQIIEGYIAYTLPDNAVTSQKIAVNAVTEAKIYPLSVTTGKIGASAVTREKLALNASGDFLKDNSVAGAKMVMSSIEGPKIKNGTITDNKIVSLGATKITGQLGASQIGAVNANCISGTIPASRLEITVSAGDVTGSWPTSRLDGSIDATKISGTLDVNRIPTIPTTKLSGTLTVSRITNNGGSTLEVNNLAGSFPATRLSGSLDDITGTLSTAKGGYTYANWKSAFVADSMALRTNSFGTADPSGTPANGTLYFKIVS